MAHLTRTMWLRVASLLVVFASLVLSVSAQTAPAGEWFRVRSQNFVLIGNAPEPEIRRAAQRLEEFKATLEQLMGSEVGSGRPLTVVLFRDDSAYRPFKPVRNNSTADDQIAGYFQPSQEHDFITLALRQTSVEADGTLFHEFVHYFFASQYPGIDVPEWVGEGLAEYFRTAVLLDSGSIRLGSPIQAHIRSLTNERPRSLDWMFTINTARLREGADGSRGLFYAQSWAIVHMLMQRGGDSLRAYLDELARGTTAGDAFAKAFKQTPAEMDAEFASYVARSAFPTRTVSLKQKIAVVASRPAARMSEAETIASLGDLLFRSDRHAEAEAMLRHSIRLDAASASANATLGSLLMRQKRYPEARKYLEIAVRNDLVKSHLTYYQYAYLLSQEGQDEFGAVSSLAPATADKIRSLLAKAIASEPRFVESYELSAFVALVTNDKLEEAVKNLKVALGFAPRDMRLTMRLAEVLARKKDFDEAKVLADRVIAVGPAGDLRVRAKALVVSIADQREFERQMAERNRWSSAGRPVKRIENVPKPPDSEIDSQQSEERIRSLNDAVRRPGSAETRVIGRLEGIDCSKRPLVFLIQTDKGRLFLTVRDLADLSLISLDPKATNIQIGCDSRLAHLNALVTYRPSTAKDRTISGELIAIEFVPADFRIMTDAEMNASTLVVYDLPKDAAAGPATPGQSLESRRKVMIEASIRSALTPLATGQKREIALLQEIECSSGVVVYRMKGFTDLRLKQKNGVQPKVVVFTPELLDLRFRCGLGSVEFPAVVTYVDKADDATKTVGELISIEFVPKGFTLGN